MIFKIKFKKKLRYIYKTVNLEDLIVLLFVNVEKFWVNFLKHLVFVNLYHWLSYKKEITNSIKMDTIFSSWEGSRLVPHRT